MAFRNVASSRQPSPCPIPASRQTGDGHGIRLDGPLSGHCAAGADVFGAGIHRRHSRSLPPSWCRNESLRSRSLCHHVQSCSRAAVAKNLTIQVAAVTKGSDGARGESCFGTHWRNVLAGGVLRPLGSRRERMAPNRGVYRKQSCQSGTGQPGRGLPLVERRKERRDESRRCRHECLRHIHWFLKRLP